MGGREGRKKPCHPLCVTNPRPLTIHPKPYTLNPTPETLHPKPTMRPPLQATRVEARKGGADNDGKIKRETGLGYTFATLFAQRCNTLCGASGCLCEREREGGREGKRERVCVCVCVFVFVRLCLRVCVCVCVCLCIHISCRTGWSV